MLTPERQAKICKLLAEGNFFHTACILSGIDRTTGFSWIRRGKEGEQPYADFVHAVNVANAECEKNGVQIIMQAAMMDPKQYQAIFKLFAIKFKRRWRETNNVELTGKRGAPVSVTLADIDRVRQAVKKNAETSGVPFSLNSESDDGNEENEG